MHFTMLVLDRNAASIAKDPLQVAILINFCIERCNYFEASVIMASASNQCLLSMVKNTSNS